MSNFISQIKGNYTVMLTKPVGTYGLFTNETLTFNTKIPRQTLTLKSLSVFFETDADALNCLGCLKIKFPFLNFNLEVDNSNQDLYFTVPISGSKITYNENMDKTLTMSKDADKSYQVSVVGADGLPADKLAYVILDFQTEYSNS